MGLNLHWQLSTPTRALKGEVQEGIRKRLSSYGGRASGEVQRANDVLEEEAPRPSLRWRDSLPLSLPHPTYNGYFERKLGFSLPKLALLLFVLMVGITIPALSWYCAVPMTSMADITALYNTFSVWALVFSVWFLGEKWNRYKVLSVLMACGGVVVVAYGGSEHRRVVGGGASGGGQTSITTSATATATATSTPAPSSSDVLSSSSSSTTSSAIAAMVTRAAVSAITARADDSPSEPSNSAANPLLGDLLALFGAVTMAAYEMAFKLLGTLPDEEEQRRRWEGVREGERGNGHEEDDEEEGTGLLQHEEQHILGDDEEEDGKPHADAAPSLSRSLSATNHHERTAIWTPPTDIEGEPSPSYGYGSGDTGSATLANSSTLDTDTLSRKMDAMHDDMDDTPSDIESSILDEGDAEEIQRGSTRLGRSRPRPKSHLSTTHTALSQASTTWIPPPLPFGLHANAMTAGIGLITALTLWLGVVIAHVTHLERFELPSNWTTVFFILFVITAGIIFNGCFMVLLAIWGPVTASVSCLLSTVAVAILDAIIRAHWSAVSLVGCVFIVGGFGVLLLDEGGGH